MRPFPSSVVDCLLEDMNKSADVEVQMQLPLPELCAGEKAGLPFVLCTAQGCQARGQKSSPRTLMQHDIRGGSHFMLTPRGSNSFLVCRVMISIMREERTFELSLKY